MELLLALWMFAHDHSDPHRQWYQSQTDAKGRSCCNDNDWGKPTDWRRTETGYQILFNDAWMDVPPDAVLSGTSPEGVPVVWYVVHSGKLLIRCFIPGAEG